MEVRRNNSKKRSAILNALSETKSHPTAEMLYNTLKKSDSELGIATVYRNLAILQEEGSVISVGTVNGQERYDANTYPHGHFICRDCGNVYDFDLPREDISGSLLSPGFSAERLEVRITGRCAACSAV